MTNGDFERAKERKKILLHLSYKKFPDAEIKQTTGEDPWKIRIEVSLPKKIALVLQAERPLLTDVDNNFELIFKKGIELAKRVFLEPPLDKKIYQGKILLDNDGVEFKLREDLKGIG